MEWSTSVLSTASADTDPAIIVNFPNARYMFNAGENTVRSFAQGECSKKKMRGIFFTQLGVHRAGGVAGLLMTLADATLINDLTLTGPKGLTHYLASMRLYTYRDTLRLFTKEIPSVTNPPESPTPEPTPIYKDENIAVYALPLFPSPLLDLLSDDVLVETASSPIPKRKRDPSPESSRKRSNVSGDALSPSILPDTNAIDDSPSLQTLMLRPGFRPARLLGETAQEWKDLIIKTMFPATVQSRELAKGNKDNAVGRKGKKNGKEKVAGKANWSPGQGAVAELAIPEDTTNVDDYRRSRKRLPLGFYSQLPPPFLVSSSSSSSSSQIPRHDPSTHPYSYVIVGPRLRGRFDAKRADALRIPHGPMRGWLSNGQTITFTVTEKGEDGKVEEKQVTVKPEDCVGESQAPSVLMVLDVPSPSHIPSLLAYFRDSPFFEQFRSEKPEHKKEYTIRGLFHLCGQGVLEDEIYVSFMNGFGREVEHIVSSREHLPNPVTFTSAAFNQLRLNQLDPTMFPVPHYKLDPLKSLSTISDLPKNTQPMVANLKMNIRPFSKPVLDPMAVEKDKFHPLVKRGDSVKAPLSEATLAKFKAARKAVTIREAEKLEEERVRMDYEGSEVVNAGKDVAIIPLGTGSAVPGKYRTVSSTLIKIPNWGNVLLDAGEGTYHQLTRHFGEEGLQDVLRNLKCLFVSHMHGDHHMGVPMILKKRLELEPPPSEPLYLVSIRSVHLYLRELQELQYLGINDDPSRNGVVTIMSEALHYIRPGVYPTSGMWNIGGNEEWTNANRSVNNAKVMCNSLGLKDLRTVDVHHGTKCYGVVLEHKDGWSIVFSGDTGPTDNLVNACQNATLLIHEATMVDGEEDLARQKKHSTFGQAIKIGEKMKAQNILLTHFSARYPKIPMSLIPSSSNRPSSPEDRLFQQPKPVIALAFDHASMTIGNMWKMQYYLKALKQSLNDTVRELGEEDDDDDNTALRMGMDS